MNHGHYGVFWPAGRGVYQWQTSSDLRFRSYICCIHLIVVVYIYYIKGVPIPLFPNTFDAKYRAEKFTNTDSNTDHSKKAMEHKKFVNCLTNAIQKLVRLFFKLYETSLLERCHSLPTRVHAQKYSPPVSLHIKLFCGLSNYKANRFPLELFV